MGDNDFPVALGGTNPAVGFLKEYTRGYNDYSQAGTSIPSLRMQNKYAQEFGGPLVGETKIAGDPSFEIYPDIDSPEIDKWVYGSGQQYPKLDMEQFNKRLELLRQEVHRILKKA